LVPDETLSTILRLLPPTAILVAIIRLQAYRPAWIAWALIAGTCCGVILGALQLASGASPDSPWYLYPISNFGTAVGFFANGNHMAILLVATLPFLFALLAAGNPEKGKKAFQKRSALLALSGGLLALILLGLFLNRSLAGLGLGLPVLAASAILLARPERQKRWLAAPLLLAMAAIGTIFMLPVSASFQSLGANESVESRRVIAATSWKAARDFMPVGAGLGSFPRVYRLYEDPRTVQPSFVNHAHNDYLEVAVEAGVPGILWMLLFLFWWGAAAHRRWSEGTGDPFAKAATIASAAILTHSLVDYPLRTSALAAVFAMTAGLIARVYYRPPAKTESDIRPARHLEIR
jgi:O-antigen ligase